MGPTTFREQLRTIFGLRLTRAEVGGLVSVFGLHRGGMVDAKEFAFRCARECANNLRSGFDPFPSDGGRVGFIYHVIQGNEWNGRSVNHP